MHQHKYSKSKKQINMKLDALGISNAGGRKMVTQFKTFMHSARIETPAVGSLSTRAGACTESTKPTEGSSIVTPRSKPSTPSLVETQKSFRSQKSFVGSWKGKT